MIPENQELKSRARETLLGHYNVIIWATLLTEVIGALLATFFDFSGNTFFSLMMASAATFILSVLFIMLNAGLHYMHLQLTRQRSIRVTDVFFCFRQHADTSIRLALLISLVNLLVTVPFGVFRMLFGRALAPLWAYILYLALYAAAAFTVNLLYSMAFFLFFDAPHQRAVELMKESRLLTRGLRLRLAGLILSFIGYMLLCVLSLGLALLWVSPYLGTTIAHFYLSLREAADAEAEASCAPGLSDPETDPQDAPLD